MRVVVICLLVTVLVTVSEVKGEGMFVKLCGREFIRAVIYTCGGSRWRRLLDEPPQELPDGEGEFSVSIGNSEHSELQKRSIQLTGMQNEDFFSHRPHFVEELLETAQNSARKRRDLNQILTTACCQWGCSKKELISLC
ncbi:insulin-like 5a [Latimeria chalumnae]|uniref:insulin-like 5a n=1 Tax=Latimeria chalumnae TaxID=7897 RepID=UPI0006D8E923|nr:PREDICTED: insulin-like peptide INSL5 [Latimeria chalumnae]|eukprot:XP_014345512.1 PREDICTED: insulin-like peptide INSL5 [Latimeria chalumnae]